jgi:hypothetical protein
MEEKLAKLSSGIVGGSFIVIGLVFVLLYGIPHLFTSGVTNNLFVVKAIVISIVYIYSVYLVATLPGKSIKRRAYSWSFSIIFHLCLLVYLGVFNNWGNTIIFIGMAETAILVFSILGVGVLVYGQYKKSDA